MPEGLWGDPRSPSSRGPRKRIGPSYWGHLENAVGRGFPHKWALRGSVLRTERYSIRRHNSGPKVYTCRKTRCPFLDQFRYNSTASHTVAKGSVLGSSRKAAGHL